MGHSSYPAAPGAGWKRLAAGGTVFARHPSGDTRVHRHAAGQRQRVAHDMDGTGIEPWQWDEATWRGHVERVRAGRSLAPRAWPGGARVAVGLSFDADHETIPLRDGETRPGRLSQGEYGSRVAAPRILRLLERQAVKASFFMPAV